MKRLLNMQIGSRVRAQREYLGMSREKLCEFVAISPQFLSEIERGVKGVSAETLCKLCQGLGASADYILLGKTTTADTSALVALLATLDAPQLTLAEDLLKTFVKTISLSNKE